MNHTRECFAAHMGIYAMEPVWMRQAVQSLKAGLGPVPQAAVRERKRGDLLQGGIQVVRINGPMFKGPSKFSEANSIALRQEVRRAARDPEVRGIFLAVDSPGGTVAGTADLADEVAAARARKPVHAFIEDLGASAAYWVASQADQVTATRTSQVGSIGTLVVVEDTSQAFEMEGVQVHVVSTGQFKGAFVDGAPVLPEHLEELGSRIADLNQHFLEAVGRGRQLAPEAVAAAADGRVFIAGKAQQMGLVDRVGSFDDALAGLLEAVEVRNPRTSRVRRAAAELSMIEMENER